MKYYILLMLNKSSCLHQMKLPIQIFNACLLVGQQEVYFVCTIFCTSALLEVP